jgi:diguanylate cyclase (GGDEF)-like protein/PAS domain S-box-containing protein
MNRSILVVDDDPAIGILAEEVFSAAGYRVELTSCGEEALSALEHFTPDVILLDIMMPGINGYETCARIKAQPALKHTPVIMLTGRDDVEAVERSYENGAWDFTPKPINWPMLTHRVRYALKAAQAFASERKAARLSRAIENSPSEVIVFEIDSLEILNANTSALANLGFSSDELAGTPLSNIVASTSDEDLVLRLKTLPNHQQVKLDVQFTRKDGTGYPVEGVALYSPEDGDPVCIAMFQDVSERRRTEEEMHRLAYYDELTGLPNRRLLQEHVERALAVAMRKGSRCALCIVDLDGFKMINDSLGHSVGDMLLKEVSHRLGGLVRDYDLVVHESPQGPDDGRHHVARLGGDEFLLLLTDFRDSTIPGRIASRVLKEISHPYDVHRTELNLTGSIGISLFPEDGSTLDELMMHADTAMYKAKNAGKNNYAFYTKEAGDHTAARLTLESQLRSAIRNNELELHYQPQMSNSLSRIVGAESLLRWRHPSEGLRFPGDFIPLAEETGLIITIGEWVMREAISTLEQWSGIVPENFKMAVNVSGYQVRNDDFLQLVHELLDAHPVARNKLVVELTESSLMSSAESSIKWLHEIKETGVQIAIDDFGTGYSSLSYLQKFPIDYLKVDRSFVRDVDTNPEGAAIVKAIFRMAQAMDIDLTVEGVETMAELDTLREMGDSLVQGWLVSKALPEGQFLEFVRNSPFLNLVSPGKHLRAGT